MNLDQKVALVTGAGKRVGRAISLELGRTKTDLALHYHQSAKEANALARQIAAIGRKVITFQADLSQPDQIAEMFAVVEREFGRLDILINNAAIHHPREGSGR